jgi:WD40 repeat protein
MFGSRHWSKSVAVELMLCAALVAVGCSPTVKVRPVKSLRDYGGSILALAYSPDGTILATAGGGLPGDAVLWEARTEELKLRLMDSGEVRDLAFSPDGKNLATTGVTLLKWNGSRPPDTRPHTTLWDVATGERIRLPLDREVAAMIFSPDSKTLLTADVDRSIRLWDSIAGRELKRFQCPSGVRPLAFSPDGKLLALTGSKHDITLWDLASNKELATLTGHASTIRVAKFSPNGRTLASGGGEYDRPGELKLWDVATHAERLSLNGHPSPVVALAFSAEGKALASGSQDGTLKSWKLASGDEAFSISAIFNLTSLAYGPERTIVASAAGTNPVRFWDALTGIEKSPPAQRR